MFILWNIPLHPTSLFNAHNPFNLPNILILKPRGQLFQATKGSQQLNLKMAFSQTIFSLARHQPNQHTNNSPPPFIAKPVYLKIDTSCLFVNSLETGKLILLAIILGSEGR